MDSLKRAVRGLLVGTAFIAAPVLFIQVMGYVIGA
jgi:hypothetical protein